MNYILILIIFTIIVCIICIFIKILLDADYNSYPVAKFNSRQITGGYQQFTGDKAIETEDSRFLTEQYYLERRINTFYEKFHPEYKNVLKILKIHTEMPEKYKRYIFHTIEKDVQLWLNDVKAQFKVSDEYMKPNSLLVEKNKIIFILRGYLDMMVNAYYGVLDLKFILTSKRKILIGPESISSIFIEPDRLYLLMGDVHDNFDNNFVCNSILMNRFDALLKMYKTNDYSELANLYKRSDDLKIYTVDEYLYNLAQGPECIDIYIEHGIVKIDDPSDSEMFLTLLRLLFMPCFKYNDYKSCSKMFNNIRVHQIDIRDIGVNSEELVKIYGGGQNIYDQYYAFLNGKNDIYSKYNNMNELKKAYKKSFLYKNKKFFDAYIYTMTRNSKEAIILNMNIELYTIYRMTVAKYDLAKIGRPRTRCKTAYPDKCILYLGQLHTDNIFNAFKHYDNTIQCIRNDAYKKAIIYNILPLENCLSF